MKIEDYNKVTDRLELKKDCLAEVFAMMEDKKDKKMFGKRRIIPVAAAAVVACGTMTAVFAGNIMGIFRKQGDFEMSISSVEQPETNTVPVLKAVPKEWDENAVRELFIDGKTITGSWENPNEFPDSVQKCYSFDDSTCLYYNNSNLYWKRDSDNDYGYIDSYAMDSVEHVRKFFPNEEIEGLDKESAVLQADNLLNVLGIEVSFKDVIALDRDNIISIDTARNENGERIDKHGNVIPEWTEEQEAYLIVYRVKCGGLPVSSQSRNFRDSGTNYSAVHAVVGRNGLEYFNAYGILDVSESGKAYAEICTAEQAADAVCERVDDSYRPALVKNCRLTYVPVAVGETFEYEMRPYWEFYEVEFDVFGEELDYYNTIFVDAEKCEIVDKSSGGI